MDVECFVVPGEGRGCGGGESCVVARVAIACDDELAWLVPGWEVVGLEVG